MKYPPQQARAATSRRAQKYRWFSFGRIAACGLLLCGMAPSVQAQDSQASPPKTPAAEATKPQNDGKADKPSGGQDSQKPSDADSINADRPGIADGSQVIGPRRFQIELGLQQNFFGQGKNSSRLLTVPMLLRFGIDERYEFRIETSGFTDSSVSNTTTGIVHAQGFAPVSFGFKRQFQASQGPRHPSVGTIVRVFPASGSQGFNTNHVTGDVRLAADWDFAPKLSLNPNIGAAVYEDGQGKLFGAGLLALTLTYATTQSLSMFVDGGLQTPEEAGGASQLIYDAGVTYIVGRNVQLDVAVGTGAAGHTAPHPFWTAGVSVRF